MDSNDTFLETTMDFRDRRKKKIVFVSQCILNQNLRFPGIAVRGGACVELVDMLTKHGIGIETFPCLERLGWGGVSRRSYSRYQPLFLAWADTPLFRLIEPLGRLWMYRYGLLCRKEARKVVRDIADYIGSGYSVFGIIAVNDSPTDGVTRTIDLIGAARRLKEMGVGKEVFDNPDIDTMRKVIPMLCQEGTGVFILRVMRALRGKGINLPIVGYDPWADPAGESARIARALRIDG